MKLSQSGGYVVDDTGHIVPAADIMAEVKRLTQVAARLASEAACERLRAEKAEAELAAERERAERLEKALRKISEIDGANHAGVLAREALHPAAPDLPLGHEFVDGREPRGTYCFYGMPFCSQPEPAHRRKP